MAKFLHPGGHENYGIGLCDRCHKKSYLDELKSDPNYPGLKVCAADYDQFDPWRLPARQTERINLPFVRPDIDISSPTGDYTVDVNGDLKV